tara:strand:+ start:129 stop:281 length:153 start_codon:yes stop_codon:yes gene_type:complete
MTRERIAYIAKVALITAFVLLWMIDFTSSATDCLSHKCPLFNGPSSDRGY